MGGDNAPGCVIDGIKGFLAAVPDADIRLFGPKAELENLLGDDTLKSGRVQVVDAPDVITMHDEPMMAVRRKTASSLVMGLKDVAAQNAQAFVSAGSTGALFLGGMVTLRMLPGISRPALAAVLPGLNAPFMLLDCGANADCQPE